MIIPDYLCESTIIARVFISERGRQRVRVSKGGVMIKVEVRVTPFILFQNEGATAKKCMWPLAPEKAKQ